jgi:hypothetical protein
MLMMAVVCKVRYFVQGVVGSSVPVVREPQGEVCSSGNGCRCQSR